MSDRDVQLDLIEDSAKQAAKHSDRVDTLRIGVLVTEFLPGGVIYEMRQEVIRLEKILKAALRILAGDERG